MPSLFTDTFEVAFWEKPLVWVSISAKIGKFISIVKRKLPVRGDAFYAVNIAVPSFVSLRLLRD